jgi:mortality factor 4-like protein 1
MGDVREMTLEDGSPVPMPQPPDHGFAVGDMVLAFHGQLLYEAKILAVGDGVPALSYRVHYQGWKMSWDEDVPRANVVEHNDENLFIAHKLLRSAKARQQRAALATAPVAPPSLAADGGADGGGSTPAPSRKRDAPDARGDPASLFVMPGPLKRHAVDDWEWVTKERALVPLPRTPCVADVLQQWAEGRSNERAVREVKASLLEYFDALLPTMLLYRFERPQFENYFVERQALAGQTPRPSAVYGAEHLVRLFIKLPLLLNQANIEPAVLKTIADKVNDLMLFVKKNGRVLLLVEYEPAGASYVAGIERDAPAPPY